MSAWYRLGNLYENGLGVKQSYEKAVEYYSLAADKGYAKAVDNLNRLTEEGHYSPEE